MRRRLGEEMKLALRLALCAATLGSVHELVPCQQPFVAVGSSPANGGVAFLNDSIAVDFSAPVELSSVNANTVTVEVFDSQGMPLPELPNGTFRVGQTPGSALHGTRIWFDPVFPSNNSYSNGGLRPDRTYVVTLPGGDSSAGETVRSRGGRALARPFSFRFSTPSGSSAVALFRNPGPGGPQRTGFAVTGSARDAGSRELLNKRAQTPVVVQLEFDQALNPETANVPVAVDLDPRTRTAGGRGRVFLEYDDPVLGADVWIPARVILVRNDASGAELHLHPLGVLPNHADIRAVVEATLEDISGESNVGSASYDRIFASFSTVRALQPQFNAVVERFDSAERFDLDLPILEPSPEIGPGYLKANFDFEGSSTTLDYQPMAAQVVLNTDFTQITPTNGPPINVTGGVFQFRNVTIPAGVTVRGIGSNPMVWLVTGDFTVLGTLSVDGDDGADANALGAANFAVAGGAGQCGGGNGGSGSPNTGGRSPTGEPGYGPGQVAGAGGQGGLLGLRSGCGRASGGGGGAFATRGDPHYPVKSPGGNQFAQQTGAGGWGCAGASGASTRTLPPGAAGPLGFVDALEGNDFWGRGVDRNLYRATTGELPLPRGGAGGGGGGDLADPANPAGFVSDFRGGGGGGGGGVLIVKVLGTLTIGKDARISADGGDGGGGEEGGANTRAGGGGGGSGGMIVLMSAERIRIFTHGETYAMGDYDFAISAQGGIGRQGAFGGVPISGKYPPPANAGAWDNYPSGGFGGQGVVQLMAPAGEIDAESTGTVLDDNIEVWWTSSGSARNLTGSEKARYLAWRGFPDANGYWVDDNGDPTYSNPDPMDPGLPGVGFMPSWSLPTTAGGPLPPATALENAEGDIRPAPVLLPSPFGHKSRLVSKWIDAGVGAARLPVSRFGVGTRGLAEQPAENLLAGPRYAFAGTSVKQPLSPGEASTLGYIDYDQAPGGIALAFPEVTPPGPGRPDVAAVDPHAMFQGQPAYRVVLSEARLGPVADRYAQHQARLLDPAGNVQGSYRILGHNAVSLWLSLDQGPLPSALRNTQLAIVAQFFDVHTNGVAGLGPTYTTISGGSAPVANVRIGFAFHKDPSVSVLRGVDVNRFPQVVDTYVYDLADPAVQDQLRDLGATFVQWELLFNTRFSEDEPSNTRQASVLSPASPRPELGWLSVPFDY